MVITSPTNSVLLYIKKNKNIYIFYFTIIMINMPLINTHYYSIRNKRFHVTILHLQHLFTTDALSIIVM